MNMKKLRDIISFSLIGLFLLLPFSPTQAQEEYIPEEKILSFISDLTIQTDGSLNVVETIEYNFGETSKHGIYRTIPLGFRAKGQPEHIDIEVLSVTDENNVSYIFEITSDDPLNIKIGDPDEIINGVHTYVISYDVHSSIGFFDAYDELYWNVTGDAWEVPIEFVRATVSLPQDTPLDKLKLAHYCGVEGDKKTCGTFQHNENGFVEFSTEFDYRVKPGEQVTIAVGFPKGMVPVPSTRDFVIAFVQNYWFTPIPFIVVFFWFRKRLVYWQKRRKYYKANTIIAEYDPGLLSPLEAAFIVNGSAEFKDITAVIVSLAVRGFLKIENKDGEFFFTKIKDIDTDGAEYESTLLGQLDSMRESELGIKFGSSASEALKSAATSLLTRDYVSKSIRLQTADPLQRFSVAFIAFFLAVNPGVFFWLMLGKGVGIAFSGACVLLGVISLFLKNKSVYLLNKGFEAERKLLGLKLYIKTAEEDRINFANAPAKTPELFEKLLPYAMVFNLEKKWAKEFENIYTTPPSWYVGSAGAFSSVAFIHNIDSVSSTTTQAIAASVPSSSRSSWGGSSGSSGGGSSGGGGGGGGGGSW